MGGKIGQGVGLHGVGRGGAALLQQLIQCVAAQLVPSGTGQKAGVVGLDGKFRHHKRGAAGLGQRALDARQRVLLGGLRLIGAVQNDLVAVLIGGGQLDAPVLDTALQRVMHGYAGQLAAEQLACLGRGGLGGGGVGLGAHTEHRAVVAVQQVAVGKAGTGEDVPHQLLVIGLPLARAAAGRHGCGGVFRRAQTPLNLHAGNARVR